MAKTNLLFDILSNIDRKNVDYYSTLTHQQQKEFKPYLVLQWLYSLDNSYQRVMLNSIVNKNMLAVYKHPELVYRLMSTCTTGQTQYYRWRSPKKETSFPKSKKVIMEYNKITHRDAEETFGIFPTDSIISMAERLGYETSEITKIKNELKTRK